MTLNLSSKVGPSGRPLLGLKGFSASTSGQKEPSDNLSHPSQAATTGAQAQAKAKAVSKPSPNLAKTPLGAKGHIYEKPIGPQQRMPCWAWLRRKVIVIKRDLPAAIGIGDEIRTKAIAEGYDAAEVAAALRMHFNSKRYFAACAKDGSERHDIDGSVVTPLTEDEGAWFQRRLDQRLQRQAQKAAALGPQELSPQMAAGAQSAEPTRNHSSPQPKITSDALAALEKVSP
jgi:hypothetical protein